MLGKTGRAAAEQRGEESQRGRNRRTDGGNWRRSRPEEGEASSCHERRRRPGGGNSVAGTSGKYAGRRTAPREAFSSHFHLPGQRNMMRVGAIPTVTDYGQGVYATGDEGDGNLPMYPLMTVLQRL